MGIETVNATTLTCDNPACPVAAGKEKLAAWMSPDDLYGWVFVRTERAGLTTVEHVCCSQACAAELAAAAGEIKDADKTEGDPGDTVKLTGSGFKTARTVLVGGVEAEFSAKSDSSLSFTVPVGGTGPIAVVTDGAPIVSGFQFETSQPEEEETDTDAA